MARLTQRPHRRLPGLAVLLTLLGCAWATPVSAAAVVPQNRWERLRALDLRVAAIGYRLSLANRALCPRLLAPQAGFVLHSIEQYETADREAAARTFGIGSHVGVMAVVAGSPAHRSGLMPDDQLVSVNGRELDLPVPAPDAVTTRAPVESAQRILTDEMAKGAVVLRVSGTGGNREVRFTADSGCPSRVELATGPEINAWADGQRAVISEGIVLRCASDGDLALVIGHELAHNFLHHSQRMAGASADRRLRLTGSGSAAMRQMEEQADRLAVQMAGAAGYDLSDVVPFLAALLDAEDFGPATGTHPPRGRRLALLKAQIASSGAKRVLGALSGEP